MISLQSLLALEDGQALEVTSSLAPADIKRGLQGACDAKPASIFRGGYRLRFGPEGCFVLTHIRGRNSFVRSFNGRIVSADKGARIEGRFKLNPVVRLFIIMWIALTTLISLVFITNDMQSGLVSLLLPLAGMLIPRLGRLQSRQDEEAVRELIRQSCEG